jgi:hypothetical protein
MMLMSFPKVNGNRDIGLGNTWNLSGATKVMNTVQFAKMAGEIRQYVKLSGIINF